MSQKEFLIPQSHVIQKLLSKLNVPYEQADLKKVEVFIRLIGQMDQVEKQIIRHFAKFKLSPARFSLMMILNQGSESEPHSPLSLAKQLSVTKPTITGLLNNLESEGMIERIPNPKDKRSHLCLLSDKGKTFLKSLLPDHFSMMAKVVSSYSLSELEQLSMQIKDFNEIIEKSVGE